SMGYWTTDFLVVQRILAAKDIRSAEMAPIIGAGFKMMVPFIVILPALLGLAVLPEKLVPEPIALATGVHTYNDVLPLMLARYCGPGLLGLGITALIPGFMHGMLWNRATGAGGFWGLLCGTLSSIGMWGWVKADPSALRYVALSPDAKALAQDMYQALWSFLVCVSVTVLVSLATQPKTDAEL